MVTKRRLASFSIIILILCFGSLLASTGLVRGQGVTYSVSQEWAQIQINTDRSIYLLYNITFTYLSGSPEGIFTVGMPQGGFQIQYVQDLSGTSLSYQVSSYVSFGIDVYLIQPIVLNQPYTFIVYALVPNMIYDDTTNPGNVGMQFYPTTLSSASGSITDLRVEIICPPDVQTTEVKSPSGTPFDNVFNETNGDTAVFWERTNWPPSQQFDVGVSFPAAYVTSAPTPSPTPTPSPIFTPPPISTPGFPNVESIAFAVFFLFIVVVGAVVLLGKAARLAYETPRMSIEALGANRTLTAVEAAVVLDQEPVRVLTMILYGLLMKRMVAVTEIDPLVKLVKLEPSQGQPAPQPRYYESDYLNSISTYGTIDEEKLAKTYIQLTHTVDQKLRGYSREDTANYYKTIVDKAWAEVAQAGTPQLKGDAIDKNLDWLLAGDKLEDRLRTTFPPGVMIYPNPAWWWYWGGLHGPVGQQTQPTQVPVGQQTKPTQVTAPAIPTAQAKPIPGQDFANNIVHGLQTASNNIVTDIQQFANRLVPFKPPPSQHPVTGHPASGRPSCVCACHACACACACVGCACACAGGGAR